MTISSNSSTPASPGLAVPGPLHLRARAPTRHESAEVPWLAVLGRDDRGTAISALRVADAEAGELICRIGRAPSFWLGVVDGLLKMSNDSSTQAALTFAGLPPGAWFGEGTLMKREVFRYNVEALRPSVVAGLPIDTFEWLLERSLPFNRYLMNQLNERLSQFIGAREIDRLADPDLRVARNLAALFHPVLYPGVGGSLRITQQELAYLVGLSRQRVNEALRHLAAASLIRIDYGGLQVIDLERLRVWHGA